MWEGPLPRLEILACFETEGELNPSMLAFMVPTADFAFMSPAADIRCPATLCSGFLNFPSMMDCPLDHEPEETLSSLSAFVGVFY